MIGLFKLLKAAALFTVAFGLHKLLGPNAGELLHRWAQVVRVDPENRLVHKFISRITGLSREQLNRLGVGTFLYGSMFCAEGIGLLLGKKWAEYFTIASTTTFLPLEAYELIKKASVLKAVVLILNAVTVAYLVWQLLRGRSQTNPQQLPGHRQ